MKKITLIFLLALSFSKPVFGQSVISVNAPKYNGDWAALVGPNGFGYPAVSPTVTYAYNRACYLITQDELMRMISTNSVITSFGFDFFRPGSVAITGTFDLYLENTTDITYNKSLTFSSIISSMPQINYTGNLTLPGATSAATAAVSVPLTTNFTWTGGGIYVAYDWHASATTSTAYARYMTNYNGTVSLGANASAPSAGPAPATLTLDVRRPQMRFNMGNTATSEVSVTRLDAPGLVSKLMTPGHAVSAQIKNNSVGILTNVPVTLNVSGANSFSDVQTVASIVPGATANVVFNTYLSPNSGLNDLVVSVPMDEDTTNNHSRVWTQSVGCTDYGNSPPYTAGTFTDGAYGYGGQAILATPFNAPQTCSLTALKFAPSNATNTGSVCGVLLDAAGSIIATTNTMNVAGAFGTYMNLKFTPNEVLTGGGNYYFGIAQLVGSTYPFGTSSYFADYNLNLYYTVPIGGGSIGSPQNHMGYLGLEAVLGLPQTEISTTASRTLVCKQDPANSLTLTASGLNTYTWTPGGQGATIVVTPSVSGTNTVANYNVIGTHTASGCKSVSQKVSIVVSNCDGLANNNSDGFNVNVYPNPTVNGKTTVAGLAGTNVITVINTLGQVVAKYSVDSESADIDLSNQASGNYIVKITDTSNQSRIVKIINQN